MSQLERIFRTSDHATHGTHHATRNDLSEEVRSRMVATLNQGLADALHLQMHSKYAHWNVRGPRFLTLHELFDQVYAKAAGWSDTIAERAVQLGGRSQGALAEVAERSSLSDERSESDAGEAHLTALADNLARFAAKVRAAIGAAETANDAVTADLLTGVAREADEQLWFVEAHLS